MKPVLSVQYIDHQPTLRAYFQRDVGLYAYALGDLVPFMWSKSTYIGAFDANGVLHGVALVWRGVSPPVLLMFGSEIAVTALTEVTPDTVFHMLPENLLPTFQSYYNTPNIRFLWRMTVNQRLFSPPGPNHAHLRHLRGPDVGLLPALYAHGEGGPRPEEIAALSPAQLENSIFYGAFVDNRLAAIAGSHLFAPAEGIGVIGYVYTKPAARGQGLATAATASVTQHMFGHGITTVVLNVERSNAPAINAYQKLGFTKHAKIVEGYASR